MILNIFTGIQRLKKLVSLMALLLMCSPVFAQDGPESSFREALERSVAETNALSGSFKQVKTLTFIDSDVVSYGVFTYSGSDYLRWEYNEPYEYNMEIDEGMLRTFDGKNEMEIDVNTSRIFRTINDIFLKSIRGNILDDEDLFSSLIKEDDEHYYVELTTHDTVLKKFIKNMQLTFSKQSMLVLNVVLYEISGDKMEIYFSDHRINFHDK